VAELSTCARDVSHAPAARSLTHGGALLAAMAPLGSDGTSAALSPCCLPVPRCLCERAAAHRPSPRSKRRAALSEPPEARARRSARCDSRVLLRVLGSTRCSSNRQRNDSCSESACAATGRKGASSLDRSRAQSARSKRSTKHHTTAASARAATPDTNAGRRLRQQSRSAAAARCTKRVRATRGEM
jgi:hypothetical protein